LNMFRPSGYPTHLLLHREFRKLLPVIAFDLP
jgi:hypothetical protein